MDTLINIGAWIVYEIAHLWWQYTGQYLIWVIIIGVPIAGWKLAEWTIDKIQK